MTGCHSVAASPSNASTGRMLRRCDRRARPGGNERRELAHPPTPKTRQAVPRARNRAMRAPRAAGQDHGRRASAWAFACNVSTWRMPAPTRRAPTIGVRAPSCHASATSGRRASLDGRTTASRAKVTPSGVVASARMRQTGTAPAANPCAGGNGGSGSFVRHRVARVAAM